MALVTHMYNTFFPFSYITFGLCSVFISHMISTDLSFSFKRTCLSRGISACKYAPGTSKMATSLLSCASMAKVVRSASKDTVGEDIDSSSLMYIFCLLPFAQVRPFIFPFLFSFIKFTASNAIFLSSYDNDFMSMGVTTCFPFIGPLSSCESSLYMAAKARSPNNLKPLFADICVKHNLVTV